MRACHVVYGYFPFDPRVRREVETLRRQGHEIHVISMREPGESLNEEVRGVHVHRIPLEVVRGGKLRYAFQYAVFFLGASVLLLGLHLKNRFQVIHVHSLPDFLVFGAAPEKIAGARIILDLHEAMPEILAARMHVSTGGALVGLAKALEWASCAFADRVITVNDAIRDLLTERGVRPSKITVVMNSPDPEHLIAHETEKLRTELGLAGGRSIVYVGGINAERNLDLLVRAVSRLRGTRPIRLAIFGYGDPRYRMVLEDVARQEGVDRDFLLGPRLPPEQVFSYISLSDVGPITYERNPLTELAVPNKVFEYAAAGKPLVIADLRALRKLFRDAALFYEPGNAADLADQMRRVLEDHVLSEGLREQARRVLEECGWGIMAERLAGVYATGTDREG